MISSKLGMSKQSSPKPAAPRRSSDGSQPSEVTPFTPVAARARHDGWSPEKQHGFIQALAESGCVREACAAVGMNPRSAYRLRARTDASAFRQSWDIAFDFAIRRLSDAAYSRALNGVSRPVFFQGEQIGERMHYDERLTMFLLRYRDPTRYGAWLDGMEARRHPDGAALFLAHALNALLDAAHGEAPAPPDGGGGAVRRHGQEEQSGIARALDRGRSDLPAVDSEPDDPLPELTAAVRAYSAEIEANGADPDFVEDGWSGPLIARVKRGGAGKSH